MTEGEALRKFIHHLGEAAECARSLAFLRSQPHWLAVQNALLAVKKNGLEMARTSPVKLIMPPSIGKMM
jgi:hypothetical protein